MTDDDALDEVHVYVKRVEVCVRVKCHSVGVYVYIYIYIYVILTCINYFVSEITISVLDYDWYR